MKSKIQEALKAKFVGVSDKILDRLAEKLASKVSTAEDVTAAVEGVTFQQVLESYGDSRATEATQTAISNYEKKHGLKDGKAIEGGEPKQNPNPKQQPTQPEDTPAWAKALVESNKALTDRLNKMESERVTSARREQLSAIVKNLPESLRKAYDHIQVDAQTDEEFSALLKEVETETTAIGNDLSAKGAVFSRPAARNGGYKPNELTKAQQDAIAARTATPSADGQPF